MIIAIDGPAGSGKSTTARAVADRLQFDYLDTGAMYRAVALHLSRSGIPDDVEDDDPDLGRALDTLKLEIERDGARMRVVADGFDVTEEIRSPEVGLKASRISRLDVVRRQIVDLQRRVVAQMTDLRGGVVVEGRDIGTVVCPDAELKVFMDASDEVRALRRRSELGRKGIESSLDEVLQEIRDRDARDRDRAHSPLRRAEKSVLIDTSNLSFEEQVERIVEAARKVQAHGRS